MNETTLTIVGNLTGDPELRFTPSGAAVCKFTVAATPRLFDKQTDAWRDGDPLFMQCAAWRDMAENAAESLHKGTRVIVTGRLRLNRWETPEGEKRQMMQLDVDDIGTSLRYAQATVRKLTRNPADTNTRNGNSSTGGRSGGGHTDDPWAANSTPGGGEDEPPF